MKRSRLLKEIVDDLRKNGARKIAIFGSYAKHLETPKSDIDIIVDFKEKKSFLDLVRIERELSEKSGIKVDLLTKKSVSPLIMDNIKSEMEVIYG